MLQAGAPFVLLDDARQGGASRLYRDPLAVIAANRPDEVRRALEQARGEMAAGRYVAGAIAYEAGVAFEPRIVPRTTNGPMSVLWLGVFARAEPLTHLPADPAGAWIGQVEPRISRAAYCEAFARVAALIAAGDIYQANLSFRADVPWAGDPLALYRRLRPRAAAGWGGIVHDGRNWLLSFSPEMFFRIEDGRIETRPMKGTAPRGKDAAEDDELANALSADPKQRAENLMIVDLIRNDLSRVAQPGSVSVPELFTVERYPTVHQMVSRVEATLAPGQDAIDVLAALFPCGSVTGAPKVRAMEVIAEVEADARGPYTGAIGAIAPDGTASFNVAIRTLVLEVGRDTAVIGLGSAVVADSEEEGEWRECLAKGAFLQVEDQRFDLFETMRFDPDEGLVSLEEHIARLGASAKAFGFAFDRHEVRNELHAATFRLMHAARVKLVVGRSGAIAIEVTPAPAPVKQPVKVKIVPLPVSAEDFRLAHKTTDRAFYDEARTAAGTWEVVFARPDGLLTEGSFTNLLVQKDGAMVTPPLARGLLRGVARARLIDSGEAREGDVRAEDLAGGFFLVNDIRGRIAAQLA